MGYVRFVGAGYPIIKMTDAGWRVLRAQEKVTMQQNELLRTSSTDVKKDSGIQYNGKEHELFEALQVVRLMIAKKRGVPAYVIFSDATLHDMCRRLPTTQEEFRMVNGVGETKLKLYGERFMNVIRKSVSDTKKGRKQKLPFHITMEQLKGYEYSDTPISVSEITHRINELVYDDSRKKLKATDITEWLLSTGVLKELELNGRNCKMPTYDGTKLGLSVERREKEDGERYYIVLYNRKAQEFIIEKLTYFIA